MMVVNRILPSGENVKSLLFNPELTQCNSGAADAGAENESERVRSSRPVKNLIPRILFMCGESRFKTGMIPVSN